MIQAETLELLEWPRLCQHLATFTATKLGAIAAQHLPIPTTQGETIQLLAQTQEVYLLESHLASSLSFDGIEDIGVSLERAELKGILSGEELLAIATTLAGARQLRRVIDNQMDAPVLTELVSQLRTYPEIEQDIHRCIDERGKVSDRASVKLANIREQMRHVRDRIYQSLNNILQRQANAIQEQVITQRSDRFVIPVKSPQKDAIPGIVHDTSMSGMTLYIEPHSIVNLNNQMRQYIRQEQAEEEVIRQILTEKIAEVKPDLERLLIIVTTLDLATAKARYSLWLEANPPKFITTKTEIVNSETEQKIPIPQDPVTLRQLRHPLLIWQEKYEEGPGVVPIDLIIQPSIRVVAITGPNTGGKTVTLKTLGLATLMAKVGLFVPAREPVELPWFNHVLADIGDEQSLEQSLSTFSGHIRRISRILAALNAQENQQENPAQSLVLLDEVGAGTDPSEGSALAIALLQYLANHTLLTIATTHFGELKALKYEDERFENASVEFDDRSLRPTYRLLWGIPGRSNALTIAKRLGLLPEIVEDAQNYVGGASEEVNQVIAGLEAQRRRQERKAKEASDLLKQTEKLHQEVSEKAASLQQRERDLKTAQEIAVKEEIIAAKGEIAKVIRRLQKGNITAQEAQKATENLNQITEKYLPSRKEPPKPKPGYKPQIGERIRLISLGQTAEVLSIAEDSEELTVRFGLMKMTVKLGEIESLDGKKPDTGKTKTQKTEVKSHKSDTSVTTVSPSPVMVRTSQNTIDLRGMRVSDAEIELDRALAHAIESGVLWIIHGKGTGQLKKGVHQFLNSHPQVSHYEQASQADGGGGVTIAYLN
ncbi:MAG: hypothetical protein RLZZ338_4077 [Cyanobacteriota bacterium]